MIAATHGCGLFPSLDRFVGNGVADAGKHAVNDAANVSDSGEGYDVCPFGGNAVPLERAVTRPFSWFGLPVVADGSTIVVGGPIEREQPYSPPPVKGCDAPNQDLIRGSGTVRVYERNAGGWDETQLTIDGIEQANPIVPPDLVPTQARIGVYQTCALAISGDWIAVGQGGDSSKADNRGSVRLFHRNLGRWTPLDSHLENPEGRMGDLFGASLALSGDTLIVGAPGEDGVDPGTQDSGAAYIYTLGPDGPGAATKIVSQSPMLRGWFGMSVAVSSDRVIVGAPLEDDDPVTQAGVLYVFGKDGRPAYPIRDASLSPGFGATLALRGDELVVGAPFARPTGAPEGRISLYRLGPTGGDLLWTLASPDPGYFFGNAMSLSAHGLVVGAAFVNSRVLPDGGITLNASDPSGSVFVFQRNARGDLSTRACRLLPPDPDACDVFGDWVAATDDYFVVGAPRNDVAGPAAGGAASSGYVEDAGSVYVFTP